MLRSTFAFLLAFVAYMAYNCLIGLFPVLEKGKIFVTVVLCVLAAIAAVLKLIVLIKKIMGDKTAGLIPIGISTFAISAFWVAMLITADSYPFLKDYQIYAMISTVVAVLFFIACGVSDIVSAFVRKNP